jgi:phosphoglucosamine mutase
MGKQLFGTDGIRGVAGEYPLDDATVYAAGAALARHIHARQAEASAPPRVLIGMDTRESSQPLAELLAGGLEQNGVGCDFAGVITTAGVAFLTKADGFAAGVMISASHNPFDDNGIKVFGPEGFKMPDDQEHQVEEIIFELLEQKPAIHRKASLRANPELARDYLKHLLQSGARAGEINGIRIVVDCANGAASELGPQLFDSLGVKAEILSNRPDGRNINHGCGSLHMETLQQRVVESGADLGVAFDGDADRALFVTGQGEMVDGDVVLLLGGQYLAGQGRLSNSLVVTTIMANMGLEKALEKSGIRMTRTPVGDKYVLEEMLRSGGVLGGEQSGHIIFREYASTGDGLLTARMMLEILARSGQSLDELKKRLPVFPQKLQNVRVKQKVPFQQHPVLSAAIAASEKEMDGNGRVVVRYSGTEPLVRIMVEAADLDLVERHTARLVEVFQSQLGQ